MLPLMSTCTNVLVCVCCLSTVVKGGNGIPVSPWIEPANATWYPSRTSLMAHSALYQEMLLHIAMAGVKRFLWFRCVCGHLCVSLARVACHQLPTSMYPPPCVETRAT